MKRLTILFLLLIPFVQHSFAQCEAGEVEVEFVLHTDAWGYELYWELTPEGNDCGDGTLISGGNETQVGCDGAGDQDATGGNGYANWDVITEGPICLNEGEIFTFHYIDDWGDGGLFLEIFMDGELSYVYNGSGSGNTWDIEAGGTNIAPYDFPCIAYEAVVGESGIEISNTEATVTSGEPAPPGGKWGQYGMWCENNLTSSLWVSFEAPESGFIQISTCNPNTNFDTQFALWKVGDCNDFGTFELITSNDDTQIGGCEGGNGYASDMFATCLNPGEVYYIQIEGWAGAEGSFDMGINEVDEAPIDLMAFVQNIPCAPDKGEEGENSIQVFLPGVDTEMNGEWSGPNDFTSYS